MKRRRRVCWLARKFLLGRFTTSCARAALAVDAMLGIVGGAGGTPASDAANLEQADRQRRATVRKAPRGTGPLGRLRGKVQRYQDPMVPVGVLDWEALGEGQPRPRRADK